MTNDISKELPSVKPEYEQLRKLWQVVDTGWLKEYFTAQLDASIQVDSRENPYTALLRPGPETTERKVRPGEFIIASASAKKMRLILEIIQEQGGSGEPIAFVDEEAQKEFSRDVAKRFGKDVYPQAVASGKVSDVISLSFESGKTIISTDSVVVVPKTGQILEKPKDEADLVKMLNLMKGKKVKVVIAVVAAVPIRFGKVALRLREGAEISIKIRDLTEEEINNYVKGNMTHAMLVAGGIDFSSESGQKLVDVAFPIKVSPLKNSIYDRFYNEKGVKRETVTIDPRSVGILADYFRGAPKDIIEVLMRQAKELQERVEKI